MATRINAAIERISSAINRVVGFVPGHMPDDVRDFVADPGQSVLSGENPDAPVSYEEGDAVLRPRSMRVGTAYGFVSQGNRLAAVTPDGDRLQVYILAGAPGQNTTCSER